jgi:CPA2 family monovalent cation:H+ antiporter-2
VHFPLLIQDLAVILGVAALVTYLFQRIKQPVVLGYILAGLIVGPHTPPFSFIQDLPNIKVWAEMGVIILMFYLGLEFSFRRLMRLGGAVFGIGVFQLFFMIFLGKWGASLLGWSAQDGVYLGCMLAISSTTIIIKALEEFKLKSKKFAEIVVGILIVEDLAAILILVFLGGLSSAQGVTAGDLLQTLFELGFVVGLWVLLGYFLVPRLVTAIGRMGSDEMLVILSLGLCLILVTLAAWLHYSVALGAFLMGSILAETKELHRIERLTRPLRDVFAAVFFVSVGMLVDPRLLIENWQAVLLVSLLVIGGKVLSLTVASLIFGQTLKRSLQVAFSMAQIGEFSFIIATLGLGLGAIDPKLYPIIVAVSVITTFTTPYLILLSGPTSEWLEAQLPHRWIKWIRRRAQRIEQAQMMVDDSHRLRWKLIATWISCGILVTAVFLGAEKILRPWVSSLAGWELWAGSLSWLFSVLVSAPFIWAMIFLFAPLKVQSSVWPRRFAMTFGPLGAALWLAIVTAPFFEPTAFFALMVVAALLAFLVFQGQLRRSFEWFEEKFHLAFEEVETDVLASSRRFRHLVPWDAHLGRVVVNLSSSFVGQTLANLKLREKLGVNILAIQRGDFSLVAPNRSEIIFPGDELLSLGSDEQLAELETLATGSGASMAGGGDFQDYDMKAIPIPKGSRLDGVSIASSGIRQEFGGLVVGVERGKERELNPSSEALILGGDLVWVVGSRSRLQDLSQSLHK